MKKFLLLLIFSSLFIFTFYNCHTKDRHKNIIGIIPHPSEVIIGNGKFVFDKTCSIIVDKKSSELKNTAIYFSEKIELYTGIKTSILHYKLIKRADKKGNIVLLINKDKVYGDEGYKLEINENEVIITGSKPAGIFYGIQSFISLLSVPEKLKSRIAEERIYLNTINIVDRPKYRWRGMMLDTCRHYMPVEFIKKFIDAIAMHKMNKFHWHLTEDQGWRIEIKKYPLLTEIGSWRSETIIGHNRDKPQTYDGKKHGGFYSKKDIREIIAYATQRYITVIPEIEMPGHSGAAIAAYPDLSCTGGPFEVKKRWGIFEDVYCAGKESTFEFLENVLLEVIELFPSEYIHIGGDECPKKRWKECLLCQERIKKEGLRDEHELQSYFIKRIEKFLMSKGKKLIGWDEILEGGLAPEATVMSWRGTKGGIEAVEQGHDVIMSPTSHCYFDYYQGPVNSEPLAIGGYLPLEKVYSFDPTPENMSKSKSNHILGGQANLWTEYIKTPKMAEYMLFPRMAAISEVLWIKKENKDYENFKIKMKKQVKRYEFLNLNYSKSKYDLVKKDKDNEK